MARIIFTCCMHKTATLSEPTVSARNDEIRRLLAGLPADVVERVLEEDGYYYDKDGWQYLLPELSPEARVLCLDARFGTTVASLPKRTGLTVALHADERLLRVARFRLEGLDLGAVSYVRIGPKSGALPFADASFDAFIAHDVNGTVLGDSAASPVVYGRRLLEEIRRVLKRDGFAYFGLRNRFSYLRLLGREPARRRTGPATAASPRCGKLARSAGFAGTRFQPYLVEQGLVCDVLPPSGYRSRKNSFTRNERVKEFLLGRLGASLLAPAFGLICWKGGARPARYEQLAAALVARGLIRGPAATHAFLPLPGKVIFSFGPPAPPAERRIVVLPLVARYIESRRRELEVMARLRQLPASITRYLPAACDGFDIDGVCGFVLSEIPGTTIDRDVPRLQHATARALDFLVTFHRITAREVTVEPANYRDICGYICEAIGATYPPLRAHAARLDELLRRRLIGRRFKLVWMHGDYKLENVIVHPRSLQVRGVIDWELARADGLPLLDTLYLLAYNRMETTHTDFLTVYDEVIAPERFEQSERRALARYLEAFPLSAADQRLLRALFALHHLGCRYIYDIDDPATRPRLLDLLAGVERTLTGPD